MVIRDTAWPAGTPCWIDLAVDDIGRASAFYTGMFGWYVQPGPPAAQLGPFPPLGIPLNIAEVARMIGCSPWTVRQTLIPRGLPHFRFTACGRLIFYRDQVVHWIENQQGGQTTK